MRRMLLNVIFLVCILGLSALTWWYVKYGGSTQYAEEDIEKKQIVYRMYDDYKKDFPEVKDIAPQKAITLLRIGLVNGCDPSGFPTPGPSTRRLPG